MSIFDSFTGLYKVSKTLRFELKPVGKTADFLKERDGLAGDFKRAEDYPKVKEFLDGQHKALIERALTGVEFNWNPLAEALDAFRKDATFKEALSSEQSRYREDIAHVLKSDKAFDTLNGATPRDFFKGYLSNGDTTDSPVATFAKFACYFTGFQENRKNVYSSEEIVTAVPYRVVNDNFPKYYSNIKVFESLQAKYPEIIEAVEDNLKDYLNGRKLSSIFTLNNYSSCLTQSGISYINTIIGGYSVKDAPKIRGVNEEVNQYLQKHPELSREDRPQRMTELFKQILSDRESVSFISTPISSDRELIDAINEFSALLKEKEIFKSLRGVLSSVASTVDGIYVLGSELPQISMVLGGYWGIIRDALTNKIETILEGTKKTKKETEALWKTLEDEFYSLSDLLALTLTSTNDAGEESHLNLLDYWHEKTFTPLLKNVTETAATFETLAASITSNTSLRGNSASVAEIKAYLDALQELLHYLKPLYVSDEANKNQDFYGVFDACYEAIALIVPLYNRVRNYLTRKNSECAKLKLMFDHPTLADGWDKNKENANASVLFVRDGAYYIGIIPREGTNGKKPKVDFDKLAIEQVTPSCYQKVVYKYLPGPNKMLPKVFFAESNKALFTPSEELIERYKNKEHIKGKTFKLSFCHELIDFFKASVQRHPDWSQFNFVHADTASYQGIDEYYREVANQGYKLSFVNIPEDALTQLVNNGDLYLFQLWNKDFSAASTGRPNLHTIYWKSLFAPENLADVVTQLNGGAELFYRLAPLQQPKTIHAVGAKLVNRRTKEGKVIPEAYYQEIYKWANGKLPEGLSAAAKDWMAHATIKDVRHQIIKDRHYTEDKYFFHIPITINFKAPDRATSINQHVQNVVRGNKDVNIIGLDRGERNLLYLTLINQKGEILQQKSFNVVEHVNSEGKTIETNYHDKLKDRERNRDRARKSWDTIGKIKDLKEGYLSAVIHEIVTLMLEHNAIIVLEDLNFGFKRGRFCVERQVYQKFEKMLIDKLNYLSLKTRAITVPGGILKGYQLTEKFESFQKLGKQSGILFYVPAAYTSKIDPTTGFTNLFNLKKCTNAANRKAFFELFDEIRYDEKRKAFAFTFDYDKFKTSQTSYQKKWTIYSAETRLTYQREKDGNGREIIIRPTTLITDAVKLLGIEVKDGLNLLEVIQKTPAEPKTAKFYGDLFYAFERTLQMRNSSSETGDDYIESPVENTDGIRFDTREVAKKGKDAKLPIDADANGAYHIALKGLWMLKHLPKKEKTPLPKLEHAQWLKFMQAKEWLK